MAKRGYLTQGKVIRALSIHGTYELLSNEGQRFKNAIALTESGSGLYGAHTSTTYAPGTRVIFYCPNDVNSGNSMSFILGAGCDDTVVEKDPRNTSPILDNNATFMTKRSDTDLSRVPENTLMENSYANGKAADVIPGEWAKTSYMGGGFLLNDFMASMSASESAKMEIFQFKQLLRMTAHRLQTRIAAQEGMSFLERGVLSNDVFREGATFLESVGGLNGDSPFEEAEQKLDKPFNYKYKNKLSYFSYQKCRGDLPQGILETYTVPPEDKVDDNRPPGVLSVCKSYDGEFSVKAAKEISFEKTSIIPVPWAIADPDTPLEEDPKKIKGDEYPLDTTEMSFFGSEAMKKKRDHDIEHDSFLKFKARGKLWSLPEDKDEVLSDLRKAGVEFKDDPSLKPLPVDDPYYADPPEKGFIPGKVDDEGTRSEPTKIFDVSSVIRQSPDGSIVISGGFGEEIRMYRGNIYLSCPGDVITTPGRDSVLMAGGNNIQKANKGATEIDGRSVTVMAEGNLQAVAGYGGEAGTLIIENKSLMPIDMENYEKDMAINEPSGGGVVLKGSAVASISDNIYMQNASDNESQITMKTNQLVAVADQEDHYVQSGGSYLVASESGMMALSGSNVSLVGQRVGINATTTICHAGKVDVEFRGKDDNTSTKSMGGGGVAGLVVKNDIAAGSLAVTGGVSNNSGEVGVSGSEFSRSFNRIFNQPPPGTGYDKLGLPEPLTETARNKKLAEWGIVLAESRYVKLELPQSEWHTMLGDSSSKWKQAEMAKSFESGFKPVMSYPGKDNFEASGSLKKLGKDGKVEKRKLSEDLVINSK